jgi:hypothetical protein
MRKLWEREGNYEKRKLLWMLLPGVLLSLVVFTVYKINRSWLLALPRGIYQFPEEIAPLFGLKEGLGTGSVSFYLLFFAEFLNFWMLWNACSRMINSIYRDVRGEGLHLFMNQMYSREQLAIGKYTGQAWISFFQISVWNLFLFVLIAAGSSLPQQRIQALYTILRLYGISLAGYSFYLAVCFFLSVRKAGKGVDFGPGGLLVGTLLIGNLWKGRDCLLLLFRTLSVSDRLTQAVSRAFGWLDKLYWLAPVSWMNPLLLQGSKVLLLQMVLLFAASGIFLVLGIRQYGTGN